jgi:transcriptional regulator with XRE-family HTH domain
MPIGSAMARKGQQAVADKPLVSFAELLRRLRVDARLTQEELAEAAGLSPRSVSDLERGVNRTAQRGTALLLADALSLSGPRRERFIAAARGKARPTPQDNLPAELTPFIGRDREAADVRALADTSRLVTLTGPGGAGKTRLARHRSSSLSWTTASTLSAVARSSPTGCCGTARNSG